MTHTTGDVHAKLREARFFVGHMQALDGHSRLDRNEEFTYFVSAFLNAAYSVQEVLRKYHQQSWHRERDGWYTSMDADLKTLVDALRETRRIVVHRGTDPTSSKVVQEPALHHTSPAIAPWAYDEQATIGVSRFYISLEGNDMPAIDVSRRYVSALEELVSRCVG